MSFDEASFIQQDAEQYNTEFDHSTSLLQKDELYEKNKELQVIIDF